MSTWRPIHPPALWKRWLPGWLHGPVKLLFQLTVTGLVVLSGIAFFYFMLAMRYDMAEVAKLPAGIIYLDRKGVEITAPGTASRKLVARGDIPEFLVKSLRAREDARFFEHRGVDVDAIGRYARASGDDNPVHLDPAAARAIGLTDQIATACW